MVNTPPQNPVHNMEPIEDAGDAQVDVQVEEEANQAVLARQNLIHVDLVQNPVAENMHAVADHVEVEAMEPAIIQNQERAIVPVARQGRKIKGNEAAPSTVAEVCRSSRIACLKAGFKDNVPIGGASSSDGSDSGKNLEAEFLNQVINQDAPPPPHLLVPLMQAIDTSTCQIAPRELTEEDLNYDSSYDSVESD